MMSSLDYLGSTSFFFFQISDRVALNSTFLWQYVCTIHIYIIDTLRFLYPAWAFYFQYSTTVESYALLAYCVIWELLSAHQAIENYRSSKFSCYSKIWGLWYLTRSTWSLFTGLEPLFLWGLTGNLPPLKAAVWTYGRRDFQGFAISESSWSLPGCCYLFIPTGVITLCPG